MHAFFPRESLAFGVARRAKCSVISRSSLTELLTLRSFSGTQL